MRNFRNLLKQPLFSGIIILTFALGIGVNTAIFTVVNAVVLRPLPFHEPKNLVDLGIYDTTEATKNPAGHSVSYPDFEDWRSQNRVFDSIAVYTNQGLTLTDGQEATHLVGQVVSSATFNLLGISPFLGRSFLPKEDDPGTHVAILSYQFWQTHFGADREIVGKSVTLDGVGYNVVGVMPKGFTFPLGYDTNPTEIWVTFSSLREIKNGSEPMTAQRGNNFLGCVARLKSGVSLAQAQANMDTIEASLAKQYPDSDARYAVMVRPLAEVTVGQTHSALMMLSAMAGCVLLVACVNVANLLLARSVSRQREISIRTALGAGRWEIVKQLLGESVLLGIGGGLAGLLMAVWSLDTIKQFLPTNIPRADRIGPDTYVFVFTAVVSLLVGIFAGILPAWRATNPNIVGSLNESARGSTEGVSGRKLRSALVVIEIVLALLLLSSAALLVQSFLRLQRVSPGFDRTNVFTSRISLPDATYGKPEQSAAFYDKLFRRVETLPGVESASGAWWIPLSGSEIMFAVDIQERPLPKGQQPDAQVDIVGPHFLKALRIPLLRGRDFNEHDTIKAPPVAIVTEAFAKKFFPNEDPIGKRITPSGSIEPGDPPVREIVGVIGDIHLTNLNRPVQPQIYLPHQQFAIQGMSLFVRSSLSPSSLFASLRTIVAEQDKDVPVYRPRLLTEYISASIAQPRFNAILVGLFALLALLLAAAGVFGVMSYTVTQRTQEIGIRLALGAQKADVLRLIVGQAMRLVVAGVVMGCIGVFVLARLLQGMLFGVGPTDLPTLLGASFVLGLVALIACWFPGVRASRVDPVVALRAE